MRHLVPALLLAACLSTVAAPSASAAELKLLSQGLPETAYTGGAKEPAKPGDNGPAKAFDGKLATAFNNGPTFPTWLMVDLGADYRVIKVMTFLERTHVWYHYVIEVSSDQQTWTTFADQKANQDPSEDPSYTDMGRATGRYVRFTLLDAPDRDKNPPWHWAVFKELQVYGVPAEPAKPAPAPAPAAK